MSHVLGHGFGIDEIPSRLKLPGMMNKGFPTHLVAAFNTSRQGLFQLPLVAFVLAASLGLSSAATAPTNAPAKADKAEVKADEKATAAPAVTRLKLLNAGAEPRKALRLSGKPGDKQSMTMTMKMSMNVGAGGEQAMAMKIPAIKMPFDVTTTSVAESGDISYDIVMRDPNVVEDADSMPGMLDAMKASLGSMKGLSGKGTVSNRGFNKATDLKLPADANPQFRQVMDQMNLSQMSSPLPEEAVGPGAKWEVTMPIQSQGLSLEQKSTCEVVSIEGSIVKLKTSIVQNAANQKIENPAAPGLEMTLKQMTGSGTGTTTMDLRKLMPTEGTVDFHADMSMAVNTGEGEQTMTTKVEMNMRLTPE